MCFFTNIFLLMMAVYGVMGDYPSQRDYNILREYIREAQNYSKDYSMYDSNEDDVDEDSDRDMVPKDRMEIFNSRYKKSRTLCTVRKMVRTHELGAQILPRRYHEYECVPFQGDLLDGNLHTMGVCWNHGVGCDTVEKYHYYIRKNSDEKCWILEKTVVKAGCKCFPYIRD